MARAPRAAGESEIPAGEERERIPFAFPQFFGRNFFPPPSLLLSLSLSLNLSSLGFNSLPFRRDPTQRLTEWSRSPLAGAAFRRENCRCRLAKARRSILVPHFFLFFTYTSPLPYSCVSLPPPRSFLSLALFSPFPWARAARAPPSLYPALDIYTAALQTGLSRAGLGLEWRQKGRRGSKQPARLGLLISQGTVFCAAELHLQEIGITKHGTLF
ncbi:DNA-binding protein inhibitor ID-4 isoform X2 [Podarcis raffonei]|uniref:DNA-binding protein inhibitor ID-4 isoform X2 n=1 Tax=Podarcis raffonei TaxID=65483 RepID=UPI00232984F9|nr:DNA-binding protein inhibitor ID-4 isoform X2 [Podarcis raffonei]